MTFDLLKVCRYCIQERDTLISLYIDDQLLERLMAMSSRIKVSERDELPKKMCNVCIGRLNMCNKIQTQFELADNTLHDYVKNKDEKRLHESIERLDKILKLNNINEVIKEKEKWIGPVTTVDCATWTQEDGEEDQMIVDTLPDTLLPKEIPENVEENASSEQNRDDRFQYSGHMFFKENPVCERRSEIKPRNFKNMYAKRAYYNSNSRSMQRTDGAKILSQRIRRAARERLSKFRTGKHISLYTEKAAYDSRKKSMQTEDGAKILSQSVKTGGVKRRKHASLLVESECKQVVDLNSKEVPLHDPASCKRTSDSGDSEVKDLVVLEEQQNIIDIFPNVMQPQQTDKSPTGSNESLTETSSNEVRSTNITMLKTANMPQEVANEIPNASSSKSIENLVFESQSITNQIQAIDAASSELSKQSQTSNTGNTENSGITLLASALKNAISLLQVVLAQKQTENAKLPVPSETQPAESITVEKLCSGGASKTHIAARDSTVVSQNPGSADLNPVHDAESHVQAEETTDVNENIDNALETNTGLHTVLIEKSVPVNHLQIHCLEKNRMENAIGSKDQEKNSFEAGNLVVTDKCIAFKAKDSLTSDKSIRQTLFASPSGIASQNMTRVSEQGQEIHLTKLADVAGTKFDRSDSSKVTQNCTEKSQTLESVSSTSSSANTVQQMESKERWTHEEGQLLLSEQSSCSVSSTSRIPDAPLCLETVEPQTLAGGFSKQTEETQTLISVESPSVTPTTLRVLDGTLQMEKAEMKTLDGNFSLQTDRSQTLVLVESPSVSSPTLGLPKTTLAVETSETQTFEGDFSLQTEESQTLVSVESRIPDAALQLKTAEMQTLEGGFLLQTDESGTMVSAKSPSISSPASRAPDAALPMRTAEMQNHEGGFSLQRDESGTMVSAKSPSVSPPASKMPDAALQMKIIEMQTHEGGLLLHTDESGTMVSAKSLSVSSPASRIPDAALQMKMTEVQTLEEGFSLQTDESGTVVSAKSPSVSSPASIVQDAILQMKTGMQILEGGSLLHTGESGTVVSAKSPSVSSPASRIPDAVLQIKMTEMQTPEGGFLLQIDESGTMVSAKSPSVSSPASRVPDAALQLKTAEMQTLGGFSLQTAESQSMASVESASVSCPTLRIANAVLQMDTEKIQTHEGGFSSQTIECETKASVSSAMLIPNTVLQMDTAELLFLKSDFSPGTPGTVPQMEVVDMQVLDGGFPSQGEHNQAFVSFSLPPSLPNLGTQQVETPQPSFLLAQKTQIPGSRKLENAVPIGVKNISPPRKRTPSNKRKRQVLEPLEATLSASSSTITSQNAALQIRDTATPFLHNLQEIQMHGTSNLGNTIQTAIKEPVNIPVTDKPTGLVMQNLELAAVAVQEPIRLEQPETKMLEKSELENVTKTKVKRNVSFEAAKPHNLGKEKCVESNTQTTTDKQKVSPALQLSDKKKGRTWKVQRNKSQQLDLAAAHDQSPDEVSDETAPKHIDKKRKIAKDVQQDLVKTDLFCCETCGYQYDDDYDLDEHMKQFHKKVKVRYIKHVKGEAGDRYVFNAGAAVKQTCPHCNLELKEGSLQEHLESHGVKPYQCTLCGRGYSEKSTFAQHICRTFSEAMKCDICQEQFPGPSMLTMHKLEKHMSNE